MKPSVQDMQPDKLFLATDNCSYSYNDLQRFEEILAKSTRADHISDNAPLGLFAHSCDALVFAIAACWRLGIPFVCLHPNTARHRLEKQIESLNISVLYASQINNSPTLDIKNVSIRPLSSLLNDSLKHEPSSSLEPVNHNKNNIFSYLFTSGTSGPPKIVPLKRRQMLAAAQASSGNFKPAPNQCWLLCMPLNHIGGISVILRSVLYGSAIFRMDHFESSRLARLLANDRRIMAVSLVPTMLGQLLAESDFEAPYNLKAILLGGGPIGAALLEKALSRNLPLITSYGMTETCAQIAANPLLKLQADTPDPQNVGPVFAANSIAIRDEAGNTLPNGQSGLIWLKGPQVFDGYHNPTQNTCIDADGWFNTGDYGYLDASNCLSIKARRTDRIVTGGENVSPLEVEEALLKLEPIKEAAVVGVKDKKWGQKVVCAVVTNEGKVISLAAIKQALKKKLESYKIPKAVISLKALPKTETGKVKRVEVAALFE